MTTISLIMIIEEVFQTFPLRPVRYRKVFSKGKVIRLAAKTDLTMIVLGSLVKIIREHMSSMTKVIINPIKV